MQFDESKHPRDKVGKFTDGLGNKDIQGLEQAQRRELKKRARYRGGRQN